MEALSLYHLGSPEIGYLPWNLPWACTFFLFLVKWGSGILQGQITGFLFLHSLSSPWLLRIMTGVVFVWFRASDCIVWWHLGVIVSRAPQVVYQLAWEYSWATSGYTPVIAPCNSAIPYVQLLRVIMTMCNFCLAYTFKSTSLSKMGLLWIAWSEGTTCFNILGLSLFFCGQG